MPERWTVIIDDLDRDGAPETPWTAAIFHTDEGGLRAYDSAGVGIGATIQAALANLAESITDEGLAEWRE